MFERESYFQPSRYSSGHASILHDVNLCNSFHLLSGFGCHSILCSKLKSKQAVTDSCLFWPDSIVRVAVGHFSFFRSQLNSMDGFHWFSTEFRMWIHRTHHREREKKTALKNKQSLIQFGQLVMILGRNNWRNETIIIFKLWSLLEPINRTLQKANASFQNNRNSN